MTERIRDEEREVKSLIAQHAASHLEGMRVVMAKQQQRLSDAELKLARRPTKAAENQKRVARNKIGALEERIEQLL